MRIFLFASLFVGTLLADVYECDVGKEMMQIRGRHSQGTGIGYSSGYTSIEGFFSTDRCYESWTSYLDLRGHLFNNGRFAANAGLGLRYIDTSLAYGVNAYYDYRGTKRNYYHQLGLGAELLGPFWSAHLNGYVEVGKSSSSFFNLKASTVPGVEFAYFQGNQIFITLEGTPTILGTKEFSMPGFDANFTLRALETKYFSFDVGAGPYFFDGKYHKYAAGAKANISARIWEYFTVGLVGSWDNLFHQRGQVEFGFTIPLGPRSFSSSCSRPSPCKIPSYFNEMLAQGANRNEIIPVDRHEKVLAVGMPGATVPAIDPDTGLPYFIVFVNNTSSGSLMGTFENPFPTIQEAMSIALTDTIIYVYPGNGSPYDAEILLQDRQMLLGSGFAHVIPTTVGPITLPAQTTTSPTVVNTLGPTIVELADQNVVSGFNFNALLAGDVIVGTNINGLTLTRNTINSSVSPIRAIVLTDSFGNILIQNNQLTVDAGDTSSVGIAVLDSGSESSVLSILDNSFTNFGIQSIFLNYGGTASSQVFIENNTLIASLLAPSSTGISIQTEDAASVTSLISENAILNHSNSGITMFSSDSSSLSTTVDNNVLSSSLTGVNNTGIVANSNTSGFLSYEITGNVIEGFAGGIQSFPQGSSTLQFIVTDNLITSATSGVTGRDPVGIEFFATNSMTLTSVDISRNTWRGPITYAASSSPKGIFFGSSDTVSSPSIVISNNMTTFPLLSHQTNTFTAGIEYISNGTGEFFEVLITNNEIEYTNSFYVDSMSVSGITLNAGPFSTHFSAQISSNKVHFVPYTGPSLTNFQQNGIAITQGDQVSPTPGAVLDAQISNNELTNISGIGIIVLHASTREVNNLVSNNTVSLEPLKGGIGIVSVPQGSNNINFIADGNVVIGNNGGFAGIAVTNQSSVCQDAIVINNIVSDVHGLLPPIPVPDAGGGIAIVYINGLDLNVVASNNSLSGNLPQGIWAAHLASAGTLCTSITNNHGIDGRAPDPYTLLNLTGDPTVFRYNESGNTGTFQFLPSPADFTIGACTSCP